jgi:hypothetical protein
VLVGGGGCGLVNGTSTDYFRAVIRQLEGLEKEVYKWVLAADGCIDARSILKYFEVEGYSETGTGIRNAIDTLVSRRFCERRIDMGEELIEIPGTR